MPSGAEPPADFIHLLKKTIRSLSDATLVSWSSTSSSLLYMLIDSGSGAYRLRCHRIVEGKKALDIECGAHDMQFAGDAGPFASERTP